MSLDRFVVWMKDLLPGAEGDIFREIGYVTMEMCALSRTEDTFLSLSLYTLLSSFQADLVYTPNTRSFQE
jgi:hypothetical protein